jgi:diadenylate cyclase
MTQVHQTLSLAQSDPLQGLRFFLEQAADRPVVTSVELLLIGAVVYTILRSLEGTRGARLVRAVLAILAVSFAVVWLIAERFALERINALYPYFLLGVFLVSLVAFQTELRRLLLRLGEGGWMRRWFGPGVDILDPLVTAAERLAKKKIGALIAIERTTQAGAIAESGVLLDAAVTAELLETIFWPGSALHDLGVLVREGRIHAAGCQFPLAETGDIDRSLGSRHRAAIGMSNETDAIVVVVSEETGQISLAVGGQLLRSLNRDKLRRELASHLRVAVVESATATVSDESTTVDGDPAADDGLDEEIERDRLADESQDDKTVRPHDGADQAA